MCLGVGELYQVSLGAENLRPHRRASAGRSILGHLFLPPAPTVHVARSSRPQSGTAAGWRPRPAARGATAALPVCYRVSQSGSIPAVLLRWPNQSWNGTSGSRAPCTDSGRISCPFRAQQQRGQRRSALPPEKRTTLPAPPCSLHPFLTLQAAAPAVAVVNRLSLA